MSASSAEALVERVKSDADFRRKLEEAPTPADKQQVVADAGFDVSRDDLGTVKTAAGIEGEISDEDLDKVAGGMGTTTSTLITATATAAAGALAA
ncbi:MAG: Nif11-like leader peptide family RiPP precursor [Gaiellaceae bacterium]